MPSERPVPFHVGRPPVCCFVNGPIDFHDELGGWAIEIDDVPEDTFLRQKRHTKLTTAQPLPDGGFAGGRISMHAPGETDLAGPDPILEGH